MSGNLTAFFIFWGIWLLVPLLIDGVTAIVYLGTVWVSAWRKRFASTHRELHHYPLVTVIIPVYNGRHSLGQCLTSLSGQTYPQGSLEVLVVNNGSVDNTHEVFLEQKRQPFAGRLEWVSIADKGKAWALNAGIHLARGTYIVNIDCDVVLDPDAILNMVRAFEADPQLAAATGSIQVLPADSSATAVKRILAECEFMEYYFSFHVGRQFQTATNSLFTLAGAFSAFRADVLLRTQLYSHSTVSEDTDLTFDLYERLPGSKVAVVAEVVAYLEPTASVSSIYAQRVRWQRGQLEVVATHRGLLTKGLFRPWGLSPVRSLAVDHTLAFPRMVWTFLLPTLVAFGYPASLVVSAIIAMYLAYVVIEGLFWLTCLLLARGGARQRLAADWWLCLVMPIYRFFIFWFRLAGFFAPITEPPEWRVQDPLSLTKDGALRAANGFAALSLSLITLKPAQGLYLACRRNIPTLLRRTLGAYRWGAQLRREGAGGLGYVQRFSRLTPSEESPEDRFLAQ